MLKRICSIIISTLMGLLASAAVLAFAHQPSGVAWAAPASQPLDTILVVGGACGATIQACIDAANPGDEVHIPAGHYTESVTVAKSISVTGDLSTTTIIHALTNQRVMTVSNASVYLADLMLTGGVFTSTGTDYSSNCGGGLQIQYAWDTVLQNVAIISNTAYCGGGLGSLTSTITLKGVDISANTAGVGGGISTRQISLELVDGSVRNNVGTYLAGGIELQYGTMTVSGGQIISNSTDYFGGGVVVFGQGAVFTQTGGSISGNSAKINGGGLMNDRATANLLGGNIVNNTAPSGGGVSSFSDFHSAQVVLSGGQIASNTASASGGGVNLSGPQSFFTQTAGSIDHNTAITGGGLYLEAGGVALIAGGQIFTNNAQNGGGVAVIGPNSMLTQTGGSVISNSAQSSGGGIYNGEGLLSALGGSVTSNTAQSGAGIFSSASNPGGVAQVVLSGGLVASNSTTLTGQGGGIDIEGSNGASSYYTQTAGSIEHNTALEAGGLRLVHAQAWLSGGDISFNSADDGAGVFLQSGGSAFTQTGGTISGNNALYDAGGIAGQGSRIALLGGNVTSNTAQYGAGLFAVGGNFPGGTSDTILDGGHVASNTASSEGGGVWLHGLNTSFTYTAGALEHNTAITGGGLYLEEGSSAWVLGGDIQSNSAITGGGVAVIGPDSWFTQSGGLIAYNSAGSIAGGMYLGFTGSVTVSISGGLILSNSAAQGPGGIGIDRGTLAITGSRILSNTGGSGAGALAQVNVGAPLSVTVANSCIARNGPITSVVNAGGPAIDARGNWWGSANGPSGVGPGSGDSVSSGVDYSGFLAAPPFGGCPPPTAALTVSRAGNGAGTVTSSPPGVNCGLICLATFDQGTTVTLTATPAVSSTFAGWSGACGGVGTCVITMTADTQVTATFSLHAYSLTVTPAGNGSGSVSSAPSGINCGGMCSHAFNYGTVVTLTATPAVSSTFAGWSGACGGAGSCVLTLTQPAAVTATFALNSYTLSVTRAGNGAGNITSQPGGINCGAACSSSFNYGTVVSLTAQPAASSDWAGWSGACGGIGSCLITMTQATQVTATFSLKSYTVTVALTGTGSGLVTSAPTGITCGLACAASFTYGTALTLTAMPTAGSNFAGWGGGPCAGTGACGLVVTQVVTLTATFNTQPPKFWTYLPLVSNTAAQARSPFQKWPGASRALDAILLDERQRV